MIKSLFLNFTLMLLPMMASAQAEITTQMPKDIEPITAPFDMPRLQRPAFPDRSVTLRCPGAKKLATKSIQNAIDKLSSKGGGTVVIAAGKWLTGRLTLKSNVCLNISEGAELHFSGDVKDYLPAVACRNEGVDIYGPGAMIYADGAENIAVTGKGKLVAPDRSCELLQLTMAGIPESVQALPLDERIFDGRYPASKFGFELPKDKSPEANANGRYAYTLCLPVFFGPMNSKNVLIEGVTLEKSVFWNIVPVYCENVIIRGVRVESAGIARTDGIDIDSSVNALIEYTYLDCGDDCFTLKAGRGMDGVQKGRPTENVVIRHCYANHGAGGLTIGSETAAGIRNVYMQDVTIGEPQYGIYFKTRRPRGGGGENLWFENVRMKNPKKRAIYWDMLGSPVYVGKLAERFNKDNDTRLTPWFRNIHFNGLTIDQCPDFIKAIGLPESPIENVTFENVKTPCNSIVLQDVGKWEMK